MNQALIKLLEASGWQYLDCADEQFGPTGTLGRDNRGEVVLLTRLRDALVKLNPGLTDEVLESTIRELTADRGAQALVVANREIYGLLKDGLSGDTIPNRGDSGHVPEAVRVIDWEHSENNDFLLVSHLRVTGETGTRRTDLVGFVNGIPLLFVAVTAEYERLAEAYRRLRDYRDSIPHLFWYNAFIILTNGNETRMGSVTTPFEQFAGWRHLVEPVQSSTPRSPFPDVMATAASIATSPYRAPGALSGGTITNHGDSGQIPALIRGTCEPARFLDIVENFTVFCDTPGNPLKLIARNHQYLGANKVIAAVQNIRSNRGRLGVLWHTQGAGKSLSMVWLTQKILRKMGGNRVFVIITDRPELEEQLFRTFQCCGALAANAARAKSPEHLKQLLSEEHRHIFVRVQTFGNPKDERRNEKAATSPVPIFPVLSDRSDIIVIADEAHRVQYDTLNANLRRALPNAAFVALTGTPLVVGEEKTKRVFGDYISIYNFRQAVEDNSTVPLYYENRLPDQQLASPDLSEEFARALEDAEESEGSSFEFRVSSSSPSSPVRDSSIMPFAAEPGFSREYEMITRDERQEAVARDIVAHFMDRGQMGKAIVVSIDPATAQRMFERVQKLWRAALDDLRQRVKTADAVERAELERRIFYMAQTDMASIGDREPGSGFRARTPNPEPRIPNLAARFSDPDDPLRMVFVCSSGIYGFDVPSCTTVYLDKPMRNHTLMQTIARANRVFKDKVNGMVVDYIGVLQNQHQSLAIYGAGTRGVIMAGDVPIERKDVLIQRLKAKFADLDNFCRGLGLNLDTIRGAGGFEVVNLIDAATEAILAHREMRPAYLELADELDRMYCAILPDRGAQEYRLLRRLFVLIAARLRSLSPAAPGPDQMDRLGGFLDVSSVTFGIMSPEHPLEELQKKFVSGLKRAAAELLKNNVRNALDLMVRRNPTRVEFLRRLEELSDEYDAGSVTVEWFFNQLVEFGRELQVEAQRAIREKLSEEELAVNDLLTSAVPDLSEENRAGVKKIARTLLETLRRDRLVPGWRKNPQTRAAVRACIDETLRGLPEGCAREGLPVRAEAIYQYIYDGYFGVSPNNQ
jgi:type I restriction enzyme, R subunit